MSRRSILCEGTLYFQKQEIWRWQHQDAWVFCCFCGKVFSSRQSVFQWEPIVPPFLADISLYSYEAKFLQSLLSTGRKQLASRFNFTQRHVDDVLSINNPEFQNYQGQMYPVEFEIKDTTKSTDSASYLDLLLSIGRDGQLQTLRIISVRCIPLSLRSKTRRRATLLLPTWICSCQSVGTVNFILPFTTDVTISISILQTFRSWVATSNLRPPVAFLSHNLSETPGLAPLMNVLFWGRCDFPISFSCRDMSRNVWNRLYKEVLWSVRGSNQKNEVPLSRMLYDILDDDHIQWHPPLIGHYTNFWPLLI